MSTEGDMNVNLGQVNPTKLGNVQLHVGVVQQGNAVRVGVQMRGDSQLLPSPCIVPITPLQALDLAQGIIQTAKQAMELETQKNNAVFQQMSHKAKIR